MTYITDSYARVIKHRLNKQRVPDISNLEKLKNSKKITKDELIVFANKAKQEYDNLIIGYK